jgi:hypothetical protein
MSDGGASGGFDSGTGGGGGFDSGSTGGTFGSGVGGPEPCGPTDPGWSTGGVGFGHPVGPGSPAWIHQQHLHRHHLHTTRHRGGGSLPTSPVGWVVFVLVAIVALVLFATISSTADDLYPGVPSGQVMDGGTVDGDFDLPAAP